jgi:hypothetical protein
MHLFSKRSVVFLSDRACIRRMWQGVAKKLSYALGFAALLAKNYEL